MRVNRDTAFFGQSLVIVGPVPIAAPFPGVASHVVKTITVGRKTFDRCDSGKPVFPDIFHRKFSLPGVGHPFPVRPKLVAPNVRFSRQTAARGKFEFRFGRQTLPRPLGVCFGVRVRDLNDGIFFFSLKVAIGAERMPPVRTGDVGPPLKIIVEWNLVIGRRKNNRSCDQIFGGSSRKLFFCRGPFRDGDISGRFNELLELFVRHRRRIHPESVDTHAVDRPGIIGGHWHLAAAPAVCGCAHREFASGNPDHPLRGVAWG